MARNRHIFGNLQVLLTSIYPVAGLALLGVLLSAKMSSASFSHRPLKGNYQLSPFAHTQADKTPTAVLLAQQLTSNAQKLVQQGKNLYEAGRFSEAATVLRQATSAFEAQGDIPGAIAAYTEAFNLLQSLQSDLVAVNPEVRFSFRDQVEPVYRQLVELFLQSKAGSRPPQPNLAQARLVIETLQLAELANFLREACIDANPVVLDKIVNRDDFTAAVIYPVILADRLEVILKLPRREELRHYKARDIPQGQVEKTLKQLRYDLTEPDAVRASEG